MSNLLFALVCGGFFIFVFFAGGVAAIIFGIRNPKKATESQSWPKATGKITRAEVVRETDTDEEGFTSTTYRPDFEYQYEVAGSEFSNTRVSFGGTTSYSSKKKAEEKLNQYPLNGTVNVYYDPQSPAESVLVQGTKGTMGLVILGVVFVGVSIITSCVILISFLVNL